MIPEAELVEIEQRAREMSAESQIRRDIELLVDEIRDIQDSKPYLVKRITREDLDKAQAALRPRVYKCELCRDLGSVGSDGIELRWCSCAFGQELRRVAERVPSYVRDDRYTGGNGEDAL